MAENSEVILYGILEDAQGQPLLYSVKATERANSYLLKERSKLFGYRNTVRKSDPSIFLAPTAAIESRIEGCEYARLKYQNLLVQNEKRIQALQEMLASARNGDSSI